MNLRPKRRNDLNVDITPLIDVVFLLLLFFMVSATFDIASQIKITLPEAAETPKESNVDEVNIAIDKDDRIYINNRSLVNTQPETIREALRDAALDMEDPPVIINADADARHQLVIRVMDAARQLGLLRITFATRVLDEQP
ncbi:MAG TPA: biopolymer transporter ExbD [Gammaproteobacteria bacterium]|nr:biopolymer transporter ExbD [Gammaproteobacteria bacterium]